MTPNIFLKKMNTVHFNLPILPDNLCIWRNNLSLHMGSNHTIHTLMNVYPRWNIVFSLDQIFRERYFHYLARNSYLHQRLFTRKVALFFIQRNRSISAIMILYVSCQVFDVRWHHHEYNKEQEIWMPQRRRYFFTKIRNNNIYMYRGSLQDF